MYIYIYIYISQGCIYTTEKVNMCRQQPSDYQAVISFATQRPLVMIRLANAKQIFTSNPSLSSCRLELSSLPTKLAWDQHSFLSLVQLSLFAFPQKI